MTEVEFLDDSYTFRSLTQTIIKVEKYLAVIQEARYISMMLSLSLSNNKLVKQNTAPYVFHFKDKHYFQEKLTNTIIANVSNQIF